MVVVGSVVGAGYCFYCAVFHGWMAGFPDSVRAEWHRVVAGRLAMASIGLVIFAPTFWFLTRRRRKTG
jgi:hypothetical protein